MEYSNIILEKQNSVATLRLNRPDALNALSPELLEEFLAATRQVAEDQEMKALVIRGEGRAFCSGADLKFVLETLENDDPKGLQDYITTLANDLHHKVVIGLRRLEKPVVAGINGVAAGARFSLNLGCDIRVAARSARFLMAYANIGAPADGGSTYLLPRLIGASRAMEMYLASQPTSAQAALEMGLVNHVVEDDALHQHAMETAVRLAKGPTAAYARVKALFDSSWEHDLATQLDLETAAFADIALTDDFQEGIKAFTERRQARFQGK